MTKEILCRNIRIGGDTPISIQSMTNTNTCDAAETIAQIKRLKDAGCQIVRLAINNQEAVEALSKIRKEIDMPLVGDIHFDYRLALGAMENGIDKIRINPGNISEKDKLEKIVKKAKERKVPIRVGINGGSLEKEILKKHGSITPKALVESAMKNISLVENFDYDQIVVSVKSSNVLVNYESYKLLSKATDYPLHIGLTEAGYSMPGIIKSSVAIGSLLLDGIGDTIRISLTGDPVQEIEVAKEILYASGKRKAPLEIISCPTCGRTHGKLEKYVEELNLKIKEKNFVPQNPTTVAVMGCEVNGPGEAKEATYGIAYGNKVALLFEKGKIKEKVKEEEAIEKLLELLFINNKRST